MAPAAPVVAALGDDLLREVFVRLPTPADLLRAAAACKPFLRAARSAPFLRRFRRRHPSSCPRLLGCILLFPDHRGGKLHLLPISPPSSSSSSAALAANGCGGDFALSFLPGGGWWGRGPATWEQLDCRNGLLLLKNLGSQELAVADPISRRCVSLPAPPAGRAVGYGLFADHGDSSEFRVVCLSRDTATSELRGLFVSSGELTWADVSGVQCQTDLAAGSRARAMQANRSLYWRLDGGERMVAFSTASMEFSVLDLPPDLRELSFDAVDKGEEEDVNVLHLITMRGFRIEVWAGTVDDDGVIAWRRVEKSVRFHKVLTEMINPSVDLYQHELDVIGVAAGVVFLRQWNHLFSIDLETMRLKMLTNKDCAGALIYPYTISWPPSFLNQQDKAPDETGN
ncbi:uncharacterized protein LOC120697426 [Panicum virgatum]|uniref:F-box protein AT5G49610-like beta-propeller domain-containing protein n=1 Tax=Panicum virgatum TaxID=38727 RepID=A0A8T0UV17_PANVG|nr:uncharacterized protein LOC120697426 [Panicum virgatum]KAG2624603.1 hypothetical protein PVAP13_3KG145300 [Panicum virgatum]KAG2624604.1 hypothetical protein PVAP13_3KG145300 [Panicum virgatum]